MVGEKAKSPNTHHCTGLLSTPQTGTPSPPLLSESPCLLPQKQLRISFKGECARETREWREKKREREANRGIDREEEARGEEEKLGLYTHTHTIAKSSSPRHKLRPPPSRRCQTHRVSCRKNSLAFGPLWLPIIIAAAIVTVAACCPSPAVAVAMVTVGPGPDTVSIATDGVGRDGSRGAG